DLRDPRRGPEAPGARVDLRPRDPGRARLRPGRQDLSSPVRLVRTLGRAAPRPRPPRIPAARPAPAGRAPRWGSTTEITPDRGRRRRDVQVTSHPGSVPLGARLLQWEERVMSSARTTPQ